VIASFVEVAAAAPDELSTIAAVMKAAPPLPFVPEEHHGRPIVMAELAWCGAHEAAESAIAPFRALADPIADLVRPMPYPEILTAPPEDYRPLAESRTMLLDGLDLGAAEAVLERLEAAPAPMAVTQLRVLGGAIARVPADATAYAHRDARMIVNVAAMYQEPAEQEQNAAWVAGVANALSDGNSGAYVGFLGDEGPDRVRAAYPGKTWERLAAVKAQYDPDNVFRLNQNVPPA
jgi:FAD/FMN-containing dehydrogenase